MKSLKLNTALIFIIGLLVPAYLSCGGDDSPDEPTAQELAFEILAGQWTLSNGGSILLDGRDVSGNYPGFALSFTDGSYQTTNAGELFNATGTWTWVGDSDSMISVDDGKQLIIQTLSANQLSFSFQLTGSGGDAAGIAGSYVVTLFK